MGRDMERIDRLLRLRRRRRVLFHFVFQGRVEREKRKNMISQFK